VAAYIRPLIGVCVLYMCNYNFETCGSSYNVNVYVNFNIVLRQLTSASVDE